MQKSAEQSDITDQAGRESRGQQRRSRTFGQVALEVFSIVLGVLLALGVSEWQENRNNSERASLALANVQAELESNLKLLELIHPNNASVVEAISESLEESEDDATVVPAVQMRSSAWQTLGSTGLSNFIDYDVLIELSQLYSMVEVYRQVAYSLIASNMNMAGTASALEGSINNDIFSRNFLAYFQMMVQIEAQLMDAHQRALTTIEQHAP